MFRSLSHFAASRVRSGLTWAEPQGQGLTRGIVRCLEIQESRPVLLPTSLKNHFSEGAHLGLIFDRFCRVFFGLFGEPRAD